MFSMEIQNCDCCKSSDIFSGLTGNIRQNYNVPYRSIFFLENTIIYFYIFSERARWRSLVYRNISGEI